MTRCSMPTWRQLWHGLVLLAPLMLHTAAGAQEHPKIELVPHIPHTDLIEALAFSPDGAHLVAGGMPTEPTLKLWDVASGRLIRTLEGHSDMVYSVAVSADGTRLVSGSKDGTVKLWQAATGRVIHSFERSRDGYGEGYRPTVLAVAFSPDGKLILAGSDETLRLWDAESGALLRSIKGHAGTVQSVAFSPDGTRLLSGSKDGAVKLWDVATGGLLRTIEAQHPTGVRAVAFSPDGKSVLSAGGLGSKENMLALWDAETGQLLRTFEGHPDRLLPGVTSVAFSPDGTLVLSVGHDNKLKLWSAASGQLVRTFSGHRIKIRSLAFSRDGARVLSAGIRQTLTVWDVASGQLIDSFDGNYSGQVASVAAAPAGPRVLSASGNKVRLWDLANGALLRTFEAPTTVYSVAFSRDGTQLLSGGDASTLQLWDAASGQLVRSFKGYIGLNDTVHSVAFSPDGKRLLSGGSDNKRLLSGGPNEALILWDTATGQPSRSFKGHAHTVYSVAVSPDGTRLLSGAADDTVRLWDVAGGELIRTFRFTTLRSFPLATAVFSPDGQWVLTAVERELKLWSAASGEPIRTFDADPGAIRSVAFSPDGTRVLSGGSDRKVKLWDAATGRLLRTMEGHSALIQSVAFSADGTRVISGSTDTTARVWNSATGELLVILVAAKSGEWLAITPEGFFDASPKGGEMLSIVRGLEVFGIDQFYQSLYRPDLVREKLAGDPDGKVRAAVAKLDLAKLLDSGRVPSVTITSHKAVDASQTDLVTLDARLADQGGGIGRAEWRINGITVGVVEQAAAGQPISLKQVVALDPGENTIELVAYNSANLVASAAARAKITWTGTEPTAPPRLYVLAVGINDYLDAALRLRYAVPDAKTLAAALKEAGQGHYEDVIVTHVLDRDATAAKLDQVFADLAVKVRPRDVFAFFAAGHGKTLDGRYYFIPYDLRYRTDQSLAREAIGQDRLQAWFARILAKKAVLMFDTCEAGSLTERNQTRGGLEQKSALGRLIQATGRATLTASSATQEAYEGHGGHGVFTFALLDALARGDTNSNGLVELAELIQHVDGLVPAITEKRWGARQFPQMDAYGSNFPLARQVAALAPAQDEAIIVPIKPTHVSAEPLQIFKEAGGSSAVVQQLPPFTTVTLVKSERGWVLIARDGRVLGYTAAAKLHKLN